MIVVIGANGQVGTELVKASWAMGFMCAGLDHAQGDVRIADSITEAILRAVCNSPRVASVPSEQVTIINTAALHDLPTCEADPQAAWDVNALGSANVARLCADLKARYIYISTDYVAGTPGGRNGLPLSVYARTKLAGEVAAMSMCPNSMVVRLGTVYGAAGCRGKPGGGNFIDTVAGKIKAQEPFTLPAYTRLSATYARDAAYRILSADPDRTGIYYARDQARFGQSHYALGSWIADLLGLPNLIEPVTVDPGDKLRPTDVSLPDGIFNLDLPLTGIEGQPKEPVVRYLIEKGHLTP